MEEQKEMIGFEGMVCTDPDHNQYGKKISDGHYFFKELDPVDCEYVEMDIILGHYSDETINEHVKAYYDSIDHVKEIYGDEWEWIVAECIFEQESGLY